MREYCERVVVAPKRQQEPGSTFYQRWHLSFTWLRSFSQCSGVQSPFGLSDICKMEAIFIAAKSRTVSRSNVNPACGPTLHISTRSSISLFDVPGLAELCTKAASSDFTRALLGVVFKLCFGC